jgi:repressor LexA
LENKGKDLKFNQKISEVRKRFGLSQDALAAKIGVSGSAIGLIEKGRSKSPSAELLASLTTELGVNPTWLLTGEGEMLLTDEKPQKAPSYTAAPTDAHAYALLSEIPVIALRHVSFKARASFIELGGADTGLFDKLLHRLPPGKTEADYADAIVFDIEGDSMEPSLRSGQQVIAWPIPEGKWEYLHNTVCVVAYDDTVTVKAIVDNELFSYDRLTLRATGGGGGSFVVARAAIQSIWEVREFYGVVPYRLFQ